MTFTDPLCNSLHSTVSTFELQRILAKQQTKYNTFLIYLTFELTFLH